MGFNKFPFIQDPSHGGQLYYYTVNSSQDQILEGKYYVAEIDIYIDFCFIPQKIATT